MEMLYINKAFPEKWAVAALCYALNQLYYLLVPISLPFFSLDLAMYLQLRAAEIRDIIHEEEWGRSWSYY